MTTPHPVILGTAGHIDHGKTSLVKGLTGTDTDRLPEEKARGITIDLGFADFELAPEGVVSLVDVPGHERFVRHMVAGVSGLDAVLLVVAMDDGSAFHLDARALGDALRAAAPEVVIDFLGYKPADLEPVDAVLGGRLRQFIFISSTTVYAKPHPVPLVETSPLGNAWSEYARQKQACEAWLAIQPISSGARRRFSVCITPPAAGMPFWTPGGSGPP